MAGDFEVVDCRTLKQEGKQDCRILSLDCSKEFLEYLATKNRNHRYPLFDHHVYVNGGKRLDSTTEFDAPDLSAEVASMLVKSHNDYILKQSAYKMGLGKAFEEAAKRYKNFSYLYYNTLAAKTPLPSTHLGTGKPTDLPRKTREPPKPRPGTNDQETVYKEGQIVLQKVLFKVTLNSFKVNERSLNPSYKETKEEEKHTRAENNMICLLYTSPSPRDRQKSRMPSSA